MCKPERFSYINRKIFKYFIFLETVIFNRIKPFFIFYLFKFLNFLVNSAKI